MQTLLVAVCTKLFPGACPSPKGTCLAIGTPLLRLIRRIVLEGGSDSGKMALLPDALIDLLIADKLEGRNVPPVV